MRLFGSRHRSNQRPSAAFVLGGFSGLLAALIYLPTVFPLTLRVVNAEEAIALRHAASVASAVGRGIEAGIPPGAGLLGESAVESLLVKGVDGRTLHHLGADLPPDAVTRTCASGTPDLLLLDGELWAVACAHVGAHRVIAGHRPSFMSGTEVLYLIVLLAITVGIITALGVLRLLRPISRVGVALDRMSAGERGVRMESTGLAELDELVDRLNAAARSVEDREQAIMARIQVVQEMARLVAHEIRNPLQSLELLTSLISSEDDDEEREEIASSIRSEIRALDMVVHRLLREGATSGALRLHLDPHALAALAEQVTNLRRPEAAAKGVRLTRGLQTWREILLDRTLIGRSIENLVVNAIQAVPSHSGEVRVSVFEEPDWLCLAVDDNGPGVDGPLGDRIFEADVTTKPDGTGLGLALVKGVIEAHGGYIESGRSALGGARFVARLPLGDDREHGAGQPQTPEHPGGG